MPAKKKSKAAASSATTTQTATEEQPSVEQVASAAAEAAAQLTGKKVDPKAVDEITRLAQEVFDAAATQKNSKAVAKRMKKEVEMRKILQDQYMFQQYRQQQIEQAIMGADRQMMMRTQGGDNVDFVPLESHHTKWQELAPKKYVRLTQFTPDMMEAVMEMFAEELPEPYSIFCYEHFLMGWKDLGLLLYGHEGGDSAPGEDVKGKFIGCIVSKVSLKSTTLAARGYIAMLAVRKEWRGHRLGQRLVKISVEMMKKKRASEIVLETPIWNERALKLYTDCGFVKTKFLTRYYMDGSDAYRLKLWFSEGRN